MSRRLYLGLAVLVLVTLLWGTSTRAPDNQLLSGPWMGQAREHFLKELAQVRVLWERDGGSLVHWQGQALAVNRQGWPDRPCWQLWDKLGLPDALDGQRVSIDWQQDHCRYQLGQQGFGYWPATGQVKALQQGAQE
ncbi:hypothetical protein [Gallaecimonas xiamenensis]|uniref:Uncharacterized protein n=1 Tax=Gallaecimonas xiamenensis 3-C-1 TaxID=745411 RepID=K2JRF1_9GAMM|nr:hypothetical protein [Gallaecimonas xiamenensis]EKE67725.1 hypothetical protein B3C1_18221 [Gallaecimonas xiamenensis 3-C-1]